MEEFNNSTADALSVDEIKALAKKRVNELHREIKPLEAEKRAMLSIMANPESKKEGIELTKKALITLNQNLVTDENISVIHLEGWTEEEKIKFESSKHRTIYGLHESVMSDEDLKKEVHKLKSKTRLDLRSQRHKKKPVEYVSNYAHWKLSMDSAKRIDELESLVAKVAIYAIESRDMIVKVGEAVLNFQDKLNAFEKLGLEPKKIEVYRLVSENPNATIAEIAKKVGKGRATVFRWLKEIRQIEEDQSLK